jgi:hypothetical protein
VINNNEPMLSHRFDLFSSKVILSPREVFGYLAQAGILLANFRSSLRIPEI